VSIVIRYYAPPAVEKEDLDVIDDYYSDSVDYSAYGSSSGELEGSDSSFNTCCPINGGST
jgi:hypothetical protein